MSTVQALSPIPAAPPCSEHTLRLRDGTDLFYRAWLPATPTARALLLFHRGHEHSGRWEETVANLGFDDVAVFAWDQRGHGRTAGERGTAPDLATVIRDADEWARHLAVAYGIDLRETVVLAHSVGGVIATAWVHDYAPPIRGLILATPAFRVKLYVPLAVPFLRLKQRVLGPGFVKSYVKAAMLTHDRDEAERYRADPLIFPQICREHAPRSSRHVDAAARRCRRDHRADAGARRRLGLGRQTVRAAPVRRTALVADQAARSASRFSPRGLPRDRPPARRCPRPFVHR